MKSIDHISFGHSGTASGSGVSRDSRFFDLMRWFSSGSQ